VCSSKPAAATANSARWARSTATRWRRPRSSPEPLTGPIFLRSSEHPLPDVAAALHSQEINVDLVGRVDSVKGDQIRNTFEAVPDAPVSSADFYFDGKSKGLFENSTNLRVAKHLATVKFTGHNGKHANYSTPLMASCGPHHKRHAKRHR
jgi:hypothetical protein